jgi:hypothetical protein
MRQVAEVVARSIPAEDRAWIAGNYVHPVLSRMLHSPLGCVVRVHVRRYGKQCKPDFDPAHRLIAPDVHPRIKRSVNILLSFSTTSGKEEVIPAVGEDDAKND